MEITGMKISMSCTMAKNWLLIIKKKWLKIFYNKITIIKAKFAFNQKYLQDKIKPKIEDVTRMKWESLFAVHIMARLELAAIFLKHLKVSLLHMDHINFNLD